jgi:hypothetical protein
MKVSDILEKYAMCTCNFVSYYKYTFVFEMEETGILVFAGEDAEDIYRAEMSAQMVLLDIDKQTVITACNLSDGTYITNH